MQLSDGDAAVLGGKMVAIAPLAMRELRAIDNNLAQLDTGPSRNDLGGDVDAGIETEDEAGVVPVRDEVPTGEEDFAGGRDGARGVFGGSHGCARAFLLFFVC